MATTGFWPVKGSLKKVLDYADNPDKTTDKKYLDDDLAQVLRYAQNAEKTDRRMYVSGVNCSANHAYEDMMATKRRFGKMGGNVAYHGYQSFKAGEVTPEQAHQIGIETARRMWGDEYEVLVTTHLNTDCVHNHIVLNSVSFRTGKKFENHVKDHYRLREISDEICREHCLSVLYGSDFYGGEKGAYWVHRAGNLTHRDVLKQDLEECLQYALTWNSFLSELHSMGYSYDPTRHSIKAEGWKRAVRLERMGYSKENIQKRLDRNLHAVGAVQRWNSHTSYRPRRYPLLDLAEQLSFSVTHTHDLGKMAVDLVFLVLICLLTSGQEKHARQTRPLSPALRAELSKLEQHQAAYRLLTERDIHSVEELSSFIETTESTIQALEKQRQSCRNHLRREKPPEETAEYRGRIAEITQALTIQRKYLRTAIRVREDAERMKELLETERQMELNTINRERGRSR